MIQHPTSWFRWLTGLQTAPATPCANDGWYENDARKNTDRNKRCLRENILSASYSSHGDGILLHWWNHLPQLRWAEKEKSLDD
jgi:hypothetical protein